MSAAAGASYSLKRRLLLVLLAAVTAVWLATAVYSYFDVRHEVTEVLDAHLAQSAGLIVAQVGSELDEIELEHAPQLHKRSRRVAFQIWERGEVLRLHSVSAPQQRLSTQEQGFSTAVVDGRRWRIFSTWDDKRRFLIQVGERDSARREIAAGVATSLLVPLLFALPVLGLFIWASIVRALRPLNALGNEVERRRPDDVAPLDVRDAPVEVLPLVRSLNALFGRIARLIENERRFTADAAHELRTPLAALKTQAQVAREASGVDDRRRALDNVLVGCDRAARLVEQLLTLARLEPGQIRTTSERSDLRVLAQQIVGELAPAALAKGIELELEAQSPVEIDGHPGLIAILLRNLIDNAIRYSGTGTRVRVSVADAPGAKELAVTDEGPGLAVEARAKVGQRFYRVLGTGESGSGLGLSISRRIAEIHGGTLVLDEGPAGKGLKVKVTFGAGAAGGNRLGPG
ncbi:MAG: ATP-binding protein [Burkholderiales bacterium]